MPKAEAGGCWNWAAESGLVSLSAAIAGFEVLATDYYPEALEFVAANAQQNGLAGIATRCVDWRQYPSDLVGFDLIVASDVLYERPGATLVAAAIAHSLAPRSRPGHRPGPPGRSAFSRRVPAAGAGMRLRRFGADCRRPD